MSAPEFRAWPKTPRLFKSVTATEKIDGTNGCVIITPEREVYAQSRNRMLSIAQDNQGFARWAYDNSALLAETLGIGRHYGEWWGHGIQRGYGCEVGERYFSLFNVKKWSYLEAESPLPSLSVVPVLWTGEMDTSEILAVASELKSGGSYAKPGFKKPEGICLYHSASNQIFKIPFDEKSYDREPVKPPPPKPSLIRRLLFLAA